jgi:2-polyprenyl-3-methyl-5-hydroxy-6-metoxy-1,4-benzoquinol methylase
MNELSIDNKDKATKATKEIKESKEIKTKEIRGNRVERVEYQKPIAKDQLELICTTFLEKQEHPEKSSQSSVTPEIEVRFGTRGIKPLTKINYDNVIKKLKSLGFISIGTTGEYSLKIETEFLDINTGQFRSSNARTEINGINAIQEYCKTNDINIVLEKYNSSVSIMKKGPIIVDGQMIRSADFDDFNFRVTYSGEEEIRKNSKLGRDIFENWLKTKKSFRYINRVSFYKDGLPFRVDMSIVRSSDRDRERGRYVKTYNISDSNVFVNQESYEIEIELMNYDAQVLYKTSKEMVRGIEQVTKYVLSGLQKTNYPISYKEQQGVLEEYMKLIHGEEFKMVKPVYPSDFIGPSSVTLQIKNIVPMNTNMNVPNIRKNYVVTDKADGERNLMFISKSGKIYLISSSMSVMFTGAKTKNEEYRRSILDGELILHNKNGKFINLYAAFDLYFINGHDVRSFGFMPTIVGNDMNKLRFPILRNLVAKLETSSMTDSKDLVGPIRIATKRFYPMYDFNQKEDVLSIFDACHTILQNIEDGLYEYNTDGLIFTPVTFGVGGDKAGQFKPIKTWEYSFKWKPAEFNTIDFLITTKKAPSGNDIVSPIFENGLDTSIPAQFTQYKTLILRCGFDENKHGYINPCQDVIDGKLPEFNPDKKSNRRPVQFFPSSPYDPSAGLCNILLEEDDNGNYQMFTEERQVFDDNTIIEFRYDMNRKGLWRWVPLRVRYDKTAEYRNNLKNYGNDYTVANDNWHSIHNPITIEMITTGNNIPDEFVGEDVYYNRVTDSSDTTGMRDFHNLFVKKLLIMSVSQRGDTLIDYACGKGGDLPKWIAANLSFVFGMDLSKDNLENRLNGACARFLNYKREIKNMPHALFVNGNSSLNVRSGQAMLNDKAVQITKAVFGQGSRENLGEGVLQQYGKAVDGFNVSSCQFAIHYMFENVNTLHNFLRNIAECTKLNGYFIGTSYDGKTIFNRLRKKLVGDSIEIFENERKIWQIVKEYESETMDDDASCIGYKISVFQDSINQMFPEYLVNYDYLNRLMEDYGFTLVTREEAKKLGLPESSGMFSELYKLMMNEISRHSSKKNEFGNAPDMKSYEKEISFLNRYFVYKKIRTIDAAKKANLFINQLPDEIDFEEKNTKLSQKDTKAEVTNTKPRIKKLNKTIVLNESSEAVQTVKNKTKKIKKSLKDIEFEITET